MDSEKCKECQAELVLDEENLCAYCELNQERNALNELTQNRTADIPLDVNCGTCKVIVEEDSEGLFCDVCNSWFHNTCNETTLNYELYTLLNEAPDNVKWFCDKCIWETEKWIKSVNKQYRTSEEIGKSKKKRKVKKEAIKEINNETNVVIKVESNEEAHSDYDVHSPAISDSITEEYENEDLKKEEIFGSLGKDEPGLTRRGTSYKKKQKIKPYEIIGTVSVNLVTEDILSIIDISPEKLASTADGITNIKKNVKIRYKCNLCMRDFVNPEGCIAHKLRDHEGVQKPYKCSVSKCEFKANYKQKLNQHMGTHSEEEKLSCHICGKMLKCELTKRKHLKYFHSNENMELNSCTVCDYKSKYPKCLKVHMATHNPDYKPLDRDKLRSHSCKQCYYKTSKKFYLQQHIKTHTDEKLSCDICGKILKCKLTLQRHLKYVHSDENMELLYCMECDYKSKYPKNIKKHTALHSCTKCDYKDKNTRNVKAHMAVHSPYKPSSPDILEILSCKECDYTSTDKYNLNKHMKYKHSDETFSCHMCGKQLKSKRTLEHHFKYSHSNENLELHNCTVCDFKSKYIGSIDKHMREVHATEKAFECKECNQKYVSKERLKRHILTHLPFNERPHACDQCDARFNDTKNLKYHKSIHTRKSRELNGDKDNEDDNVKQLNTRTYLCDICDKVFKSSSYLKLHKMNHEGEKPFKCETCGKGFTSIGNLNWHVKESHKKSIVTCCEICGYGATSKGRLNRHMKDVHNDNNYQCDGCGKKYSTKSNLDKHKSGGFGQFGFGNCKGSFTQENSNFKDIRQIKIIKDKLTNKSIYECDVCAKKYKAKNQFANHKCREYMYTVECDKCGRKCRSESYLKEKHSCKPRGVKYRTKGSPKKKKEIASPPKNKKTKKESNTSQNTSSVIDELNQDDLSIPIQETSLVTDRMFTEQHHGYQASTDHMPTMQNHGNQSSADHMATIQQHDYQTPTDRMPTMQNLDNQLSTHCMPIMQSHETSNTTDRMPIMQNHSNQPPLLLYGNSQNGNVYAALIPPNSRNVTATFKPTTISYRTNQWS